MNSHTFGRTPFGHTLFFEADNGANGGGGNSDPKPNDAPNQSNGSNANESEVAKLVSQILASQRVNGDPTEALNVLAGQVKAKDTRIEQLKANAFGEGDRERLEAFNAFLQENGAKDLSELKARLDNEKTLKTEKQQREQDAELSKVAKAAGLKSNALFLQLAREAVANGVEFEVAGDDKKPVVNVKTEAGKVEFSDWVKQAPNELWREALPALQDVQQQLGAPMVPLHNGNPMPHANTEEAARKAQGGLYGANNF